MKLAIIEDEQTHRELLLKYLQEWGTERSVSLCGRGFPNAESFLFVWEEEWDFDVLFVDIQMKDMNGMEMARRIRQQDPDIAAVLLLAAMGCLLRRWFLSLVDRRTLEYQRDLLEKHCEKVQNMYRQTRGWRHDYHNHIQTMKEAMRSWWWTEAESTMRCGKLRLSITERRE